MPVNIVGRNQEGGISAIGVSKYGRLQVDTWWENSTEDAIIINFNQVTNSTTLNGAVSIEDRTITVTSATGISIGSYIILFDPASLRFSTFFVTAVNGLIITLDTPLDFAYPNGTFVDVAITDLSVNGLVTPQIFGIRGSGAPPGIELTFHVTRLIFAMICDSAVDLSLFGNIARLTNGMVCRTKNTRYKNLFNLKDNADIAGIMYDWTPYVASNPAQSVDGFASRLTFSGPEKIGVAIELPIGEDLQIIIQDDLTDITTFKIIAEGHLKRA